MLEYFQRWGTGRFRGGSPLFWKLLIVFFLLFNFVRKALFLFDNEKRPPYLINALSSGVNSFALWDHTK